MNINNLKMGDLIVREKGIFSTHYIVYLYKSFGQILVAENQVGRGVQIVTLEEALNNNRIVRFEKFGGNEHQRKQVYAKVNELIGEEYNLIAFNCEHFARLIATGKPESKQVKTASTLAMLGGATMLASDNRVVKTLGVLSIIGGALGFLSQK